MGMKTARLQHISYSVAGYSVNSLLPIYYIAAVMSIVERNEFDVLSVGILRLLHSRCRNLEVESIVIVEVNLFIPIKSS